MYTDECLITPLKNSWAIWELVRYLIFFSRSSLYYLLFLNFQKCIYVKRWHNTQKHYIPSLSEKKNTELDRPGGPIMSFFLQLKLLVWKNYTLRKRQWVGICHVIKMWEPFWIPFSGSITRRDCMATHPLSNPLPCQTQRTEKVSPWMWVLWT